MGFLVRGIPFCGGEILELVTSEGYVIYSRGKEYDGGYWRRVYEKALSKAQAVPGIYKADEGSKYEQAGQTLIAFGKQEMAKEIALIEKATGQKVDDAEDIKTFIRKFNEILMGKKQYEAALDRLKLALTKEYSDAKYRAPTIASWFTSYLGTALSEEINKFINKNLQDLLDKNYTVWEQKFEDIIDHAIDLAFNRMLTKVEKEEGKEIYGDKSVWAEYAAIAKTIRNFSSDFREMIKSKLDFKSILHVFEQQGVDITKKRKKGIRKFIDSKDGLNLKEPRKSRGLGGSVQEFLMMLSELMGDAARAGAAGGTVFKSEIMKTDNVVLFDFSQQINTDKIAQELVEGLNEAVGTSRSLQETAQKMEDYYNQYLANLNDSFIVYGSTKSYTLSNSFKDFHGGGTQQIEQLIPLMNKLGLGSINALTEYIRLVYSTANEAILEERKEEIREDIKLALSSAVAGLLFDDWISIGEQKKGAQAIHVLQLEGIQIPISVFLIATGQALLSAKDGSQFVRIHLDTLDSIAYPDKIKAASKSEVIEKWEEQKETAKKQTKYTLSFLSSFKNIIKQWI